MNTESLPVERRSTRAKPPTFPAGDLFGLRALGDTLRQQRRIAIAVFALVMLGAGAYLWLATPVWKADTLLQFEARQRPSVIAGVEQSEAERRGGGAQTPPVAGQIEVLRSRELLLPVIAAVGADIELDRAFAHGFIPMGSRHGVVIETLDLPPSLRGRPLQLAVAEDRWTLADAGGRRLAQGDIGQTVRLNVGGEQGLVHIGAAGALPVELRLVQRQPMKAYENVQERLRVFEPSRDAGVVRLSLEDTDPERAAQLLNRLVAAYLEQDVSRRKETERQALAFLEGQLPALKQRVEQDEDALAVYREKNQVTVAPGEADALVKQRADLARDLTLLATKADQLAARLTPQHPELIAVREQIGTVERAIRRIDGDIRRLPGQMRDMVRMQRDAQIGTQLYTSALAQVQQLRLAVASRLSDARQLDRAAAPAEPERPRTGAVVSVALGLATMLAIGAAVLTRAAASTLADAHDVDLKLGLRTLAEVPESRGQRLLGAGRLEFRREVETGAHEVLARAAPHDPAVEALRAMQLAVRVRNGGGGPTQVVLVTQPVAGCGSAFVATNLAALLAEAGQRVVLIEADFDQGRVSRYAGLDRNAAGLAELIAGERNLLDVLRSHASLGLDVILPGAPQVSEASLLLRPRLRDTIALLRDRYDHIVLHGAPMQRLGSAMAAATLADAALLVVRAGSTDVAQIQHAVRGIERAAIPLKGLVLNRVRTRNGQG